MFTLGPVGFAAPWLLVGLLALPVLWLLLRAVPPAPIRRRFPGVALLLGLRDDEAEADKTPWWLLLLRMLAVAAVIVGFAGPVLNPDPRTPGSGPLLIVLDGGWADARDWTSRLARATDLLADAGRAGRPVAVIRLSEEPQQVSFQTAEEWAGRLAAAVPRPYAPERMTAWKLFLPEGGFETYWIADGLSHSGRPDLASELSRRGNLTVYQSAVPVYALRPARFADGAIQLAASRIGGAEGGSIGVIARGPDPSGIDRELARGRFVFAPGQTDAELTLNLPPELRNRVTRFELEGQHTAGAVSLTDDSLKRRKVVIIGAGSDREGLQLLSPTYYLRQALQPTADLLTGGVLDVLPAKPDVIVLADVAKLTQAEQDGLLDWLDQGGMLLRFAGPKLAAADVEALAEDPLLPVQLRQGGRAVGGAMSWGEPKTLAPFAETSPFFGLTVPGDVTVSSQVLAQPAPDLSDRTIAALADGTPLVTRATVGQGEVVLFHITANAEWSNLPLSGLFVQMLERLAVSTRPEAPEAADLIGQVWVPVRVLDGFGKEVDAGDVAGVAGALLAKAVKQGPNAGLPPGLYEGQERRVALNSINAETVLAPAGWPLGTTIDGLEAAHAQSLKAPILLAGLVLLFADVLAALWLSGRLFALRTAAVLMLALGMVQTGQLRAQTLPGDDFAERATDNVVLAHVLTGDADLDALADAGLKGLSEQLWNRTAVEPASPMAVDIEQDELLFFPFLYWPISAGQPLPSAKAYAKLNAYLRSGGMILFDTRDADISAGTSPEAAELQRIAAGLDIPPLEPIPADHVLTRSFYLLQDFPGRFHGAPVWVEAAPPDAEQAEGMPFRNLNDGVTPVIIGGNDWASAWAVDGQGVPMYPVGRGAAGDQQREMAFRFGINVVMHVLTGNYKSDQVHVPALLERLGQ